MKCKELKVHFKVLKFKRNTTRPSYNVHDALNSSLIWFETVSGQWGESHFLYYRSFRRGKIFLRTKSPKPYSPKPTQTICRCHDNCTAAFWCGWTWDVKHFHGGLSLMVFTWHTQKNRSSVTVCAFYGQSAASCWGWRIREVTGTSALSEQYLTGYKIRLLLKVDKFMKQNTKRVNCEFCFNCFRSHDEYLTTLLRIIWSSQLHSDILVGLYLVLLCVCLTLPSITRRVCLLSKPWWGKHKHLQPWQWRGGEAWWSSEIKWRTSSF